MILNAICCCAVLNHFSCVWCCATPGTAGCQAPLSMRFSRQEYWSGLPFPPPGDLSDPGIELTSLVSCTGKQVLYHLAVSSVAQSYLTLCNPMDCSTPGFPVHHQLMELAQTHVHRVSDAIQPSHPFFTTNTIHIPICYQWPLNPQLESGPLPWTREWFFFQRPSSNLTWISEIHTSVSSP